MTTPSQTSAWRGIVVTAGLALTAAFAGTALAETSVPTVAWPHAAKAESYTVQVAKDAAFQEIVQTVPARTQQITFKAEYSGAAFWRVVDNEGRALTSGEPIALVDYFADDDNDGLQNGWEMNGYQNVDLPKLGADPKYKDLFVYMDYMDESYLPTEEGFKKIEEIFANGAIKNPNGKTGVKIHLVKGKKVPMDRDLKPYAKEIRAIKNRHFPKGYGPIFHYMIWAYKYNSGGSSGVSLGIPGHDFIVSLGSWGRRNTEEAKIGTFIHELGHNLGLKHGGADHGNWKPNYISVMNYAFQINGLPKNGELTYDYQRFNTLNLNERSLDEKAGIGKKAATEQYGTLYHCGKKKKKVANVADGIDWDCNGKISGTVRSNIDNSRSTNLKASNNWGELNLKGGLKDFRGSFLSDPKIVAEVESDITYEQQLELDKVFEDNGFAIDY